MFAMIAVPKAVAVARKGVKWWGAWPSKCPEMASTCLEKDESLQIRMKEMYGYLQKHRGRSVKELGRRDRGSKNIFPVCSLRNRVG
jgi:hypothetical protein